MPTSESRLRGTQLSRTRPRHASGPSRGDARPGAAYPREGPVANAFRSPEIYVPSTKAPGAAWASCAAVVLRAHVHKRSRSNGAGMLHAVMCPSRTAHALVWLLRKRARSQRCSFESPSVAYDSPEHCQSTKHGSTSNRTTSQKIKVRVYPITCPLCKGLVTNERMGVTADVRVRNMGTISCRPRIAVS